MSWWNAGGGPIVVTGASGLLGANLALEWTRQGCAVVALYGRHPFFAENVASSACDLTDRSATARLFASLAPALIVHCAAATGVDWCESHPHETMRINAGVAGELASLARSLAAPFVYISTDAVFDGLSGGYRETDEVVPVNWYARSKAAGEAAVRRQMPEALVLRANFYGWNLQPKHSLAEWVLARLETGQEVPGFDDTTFSPILANHLAAWIPRLIEAGCTGTFHLASHDRCSKYEFARAIAEVFQLDGSLVRMASLERSGLCAPRPRHTWLRTEKVSAVLGSPMPAIREGLEQFRTLRQNGFFEKLKAAAIPLGDPACRFSA
jgi:dTDP-4-dehydrorhamnose reductase